MTDEFTLRQLCKDLAHCYEVLEVRKFVGEKPPEVRTMQNTGGKPSMPGNWLWMSRGIEAEQELRKHTFPILKDISVKLNDDDAKILNLIAIIKFNAQAISEHHNAADLEEVMADQCRRMGKWLNPVEEITRDSYLTADSIQRSIATRGLDCPASTIRRWAMEGDVLTKKNGSRTTYRLQDVINKIKGRETND